MKTKLILSLLVLTFLSACSSATPASTPTPVDIAALQTQAVQDVIGQITQTAAAFTPTLEPTVAPTETQSPPTNTPAPTATATQQVRDNMQFMGDVTVPDGTQITAGQEFLKTWKVKNTGSGTWTKGYSIVWAYGSQELRIPPTYFAEEVLPGQEVEITVKLKGPEKPNTYNGYFRLQNNNGFAFGEFFSVVIVVP
jgi:hypothetical protein